MIVPEIHQDGSEKFKFWNKTRFLIMFVVFLALTICVSNATIFNFTVICMKKESIDCNGTDLLFYNEEERSWLLSFVAIGTVIGTLPVGFLLKTIGTRHTFTIYGLISAFSVALFPLALNLGFWVTSIVRILQGVALTASWGLFGAVVAEWFELKRTGLIVAYLSCHFQLGPTFTMPLSGALCESSLGWSSSYYIHAGLTVVIFTVFFWFYTDSPVSHLNVSKQELEIIQKDKVVYLDDHVRGQSVPYKAMFTDIAIIGVLGTALSNMAAIRLFIQYGPVYLNKVLGLDIEGTGLASAFPFVIAMIGKLIVGPISDTLPGLTDRQRVIVFATFAQGLLSFFYFGLAFVDKESAWTIQICYTAVIALSGLDSVSVMKSCQLMCGQHVHVLMSTIAVGENIVMLIMAGAVATFVPNNTAEEVREAFN